MISKILGFFREIVVAAKFGTSWRIDAVIIAMEPAETVAAIVAGTIGAMMIPFYLELKREGDSEELRVYVSQVLKWTSLLMMGFGALLFFFPNTIIHLFAPSFSGEVLEYASEKLQFFSILPVIHGFGAIFTAALRSERKFFQMASTQLVLNMVCIPLIFVLAPICGETAFVLSWIAGYGIMTLSIAVLCIPFFDPKGFWSLRSPSPYAKKTMAHAIPLIAGKSTGVVNSMVDKIFASSLPAGRVAALRYSYFFLTMINSLLVNSFLTTIFTEMGEAVARRDFAKLKNRLEKSATDMLNLVIPLTFWVILMADPLIQALFQRGSFDAQSTSLVSASLVGYSTILLVAPVGGLIGHVLISLKDLAFINTLSVVSIGANVLFDWFLVGPFGHAGIAASSAAVSVLHTLFSYLWLKKRHDLSFFQWKPWLLKFSVSFSLAAVLFMVKLWVIDGWIWLVLSNAHFFLLFERLNRKMWREVLARCKRFLGS